MHTFAHWSKKLGFLKDGTYYIQRYFSVAYDYAVKLNLGKGCWNPRRKLGVITNFSKIIELNFEKKVPYIVLYLEPFLFELCFLDYL